MKVLVVYYSRTGRTKRLAERLATELGGSTVAITERKDRAGLFGYQRSLFEAVTGRDATIEPLRRQPAEYDLVLIGTPIWGWHLSSPVRAFANRHGKGLKRVAFFCTMGGSGDRSAFDELARITGKRPEAVLALTEAEMAQPGQADLRAKVERFVSRLRPHTVAQREAA
jgi:menaquinone-dependent protoporphyrinogen IX oxidase